MILPSELYTVNIVMPKIIVDKDNNEYKEFEPASFKDLLDHVKSQGYENKLSLQLLDIEKYKNQESDPFLHKEYSVNIHKSFDVYLIAFDIGGFTIFLPENALVLKKVGDDTIEKVEVSTLQQEDQLLVYMFDSITCFQGITEIRKRLKYQIYGAIEFDLEDKYAVPVGSPHLQVYVS